MLFRTASSRRCWKSTKTETSYSNIDGHEADRAGVGARLNNQEHRRNVVAKDELPKKIGACRTAFVCNTHDADKPGQHWIVLYIDGDHGEYFDSYGLPPLHTTFHCVEWTYNDKTLQSPLSNVCGQYCIAYLHFRCRREPMKTFANLLGTDLVANDCRVFDWINV